MTTICDTIHRICNGILNLSWEQTDRPISSLQGKKIRTVAAACILGNWVAKLSLDASFFKQIVSTEVGAFFVGAIGLGLRDNRTAMNNLIHGVGSAAIFQAILFSGVHTTLALGSVLGRSLLGRVVKVGAGALISVGVSSILNRLGNRLFPVPPPPPPLAVPVFSLQVQLNHRPVEKRQSQNR